MVNITAIVFLFVVKTIVNFCCRHNIKICCLKWITFWTTLELYHQLPPTLILYWKPSESTERKGLKFRYNIWTNNVYYKTWQHVSQSLVSLKLIWEFTFWYSFLTFKSFFRGSVMKENNIKNHWNKSQCTNPRFSMIN